MTLPLERSRALRIAAEVLGEVALRPDVPEDLRRSAQFALRHYPSAGVLALFARTPALADWLELEDRDASSNHSDSPDDADAKPNDG